MSDIVVKVENLSKLYHIGARQERYPTLRSALVFSMKRLTTRRSGQESEENNIWALKDVSFEIKQGEVVGIIGRNGAGKSTLLKVLAHITEPTKGRVTLHGRVGSLLEVGTGFHPELTGRDNIYLNGAILGMKRAEIERKFDEIVAFSQIEKFLDTPVKHYSSGMYVRLAFAVAAHLEPEILVVDEVLAVGDAEFQKKCLGKMGDVAHEGRTVLLVSHNMIAIKNLCHKAIYLANGTIASYGMTHRIVENYLSQSGIVKTFDSRFIDKFIGDQFVRISRVRFINSQNETIDSLVVDKGFGIEINYEIFRADGYKPSPTIFIKTSSGEGVFHALETKRNGIFDMGAYRSVVWIPGNLLNDGIFILVVGMATLNPAFNHCAVEIEFEVEDDLNSLTRGDYKLRMHGTTRPLLNWETNLDVSIMNYGN